MKVAPTGVIFYGKCEVKSDKCIAKDTIAPITAVWVPRGNMQVNVCNPCISYQLKSGKWKIDGALVKDIKKVVDLAIVNNSGKAVTIIEIKNKKNTDLSWAKKMFSNYNDFIQDELDYFLLVTPFDIYVYDIKNKDYFEITELNFLILYLERHNTSKEELSVENSKDFFFKYKEVINKHFQYQQIMLEFFSDFLNKETTNNKLPFLEQFIGNATIKEEWVLS